MLKPGEPFPFDDRTWNPVFENLQSSKAAGAGNALRLDARPRPWIPAIVENKSGFDVEPGGVLAIDGVSFTEADDENEFVNNWTLKGILPDSKNPKHKLNSVIAVDFAPKDSVSEFAIGGVAVALVDGPTDYKRFARIKDEAGSLEATTYEGLPIIYWPAGATGVVKCLVRVEFAREPSIKVIMPAGGVSGRNGKTPGGGVGGTTCEVVISDHADNNDLKLTGETIKVFNYSQDSIEPDGDRIADVKPHNDLLHWVAGFECEGTQNTTFPTL